MISLYAYISIHSTSASHIFPHYRITSIIASPAVHFSEFMINIGPHSAVIIISFLASPSLLQLPESINLPSSSKQKPNRRRLSFSFILKTSLTNLPTALSTLDHSTPHCIQSRSYHKSSLILVLKFAKEILISMYQMDAQRFDRISLNTISHYSTVSGPGSWSP